MRELTNAVRKEIMPGVFLTSFRTKKFKTGLLSMNLLTPLKAASASKNAMLPSVLRRGTARYPDMEQLSAALDSLYGAQIESVVRKKGEVQCVGFVSSFIDEALTPGQEKLLEPVADLLGELLLSPATRNGRFYTEYVEGEKNNLKDRIRAIVNDKRQYADKRLVELMCREEDYSVDKLGSEEAASAVSGQKLFEQYNRLLASSRLELFYSGSASPERVEGAMLYALESLPRPGATEPVDTAVKKAAPEEPQVVTESMDVTQGKLAIGFRLGGRGAPDYPAQTLFHTAYGGTSTSKLFLNVREKLSLCYFASSALHRSKGILTVSSGIEFKNYEKARDEILAQLKAIQEGKLEDWELEAAKRSVVNAMRSTLDSQTRMEDFYLGQALEELPYGPMEFAAQIEKVTAEEIRRAAEAARLDTIYFLRGPDKGGE